MEINNIWNQSDIPVQYTGLCNLIIQFVLYNILKFCICIQTIMNKY